MTFFEQELRRLFDHDTVFSEPRFVGDVCYGRITPDIRVKVSFVTCGYADNYEALKITLLNRKEGQIDTVLLRFRDLWGMKKVSNPNFKDGISPHAWTDNGKTKWYVYQPKQADYQQLAAAVKNYVEVFQEPVQEQQVGQMMG